MKSRFRLPGPTPLPPEVKEAMQREMVPHRGAAFREFYRDLLIRLKAIHRTSGDVLLLPGSGSAGWEIGLTNLLSPGDTVLATICGNFGVRFATVAERMDLNVKRLEVPWGQAIKPEHLELVLAEAGPVDAVLLTHNETSTGVTNPIEELAAIARASTALTLVDAVSSAAGLPLEVDDWGLDFVLSGTQKAWMCPPGLSIVTVGERAWAANGQTRRGRFFWDLDRAKEAADIGTTPTTPPLPIIFALEAAVSLIEAETLDELWARHRLLGEQTRAGIEDLGLELLAEPGYASNTVTAFHAPANLTSHQLVERLYVEHGITLTTGQGHQEERVVRVGHMGWVDSEDIDFFLDALHQIVELPA